MAVQSYSFTWKVGDWELVLATAPTLVNAFSHTHIMNAYIYLFIGNGGLSDSELGGMNWGGGGVGVGVWWSLFLALEAAEGGAEVIKTLGGGMS